MMTTTTTTMSPMAAGEQPDAPPEDTIEDRHRGRTDGARPQPPRIRDDEAPELPEADREWLEATPQSLMPILEVAVDAVERQTA